MHFQSMLLLTMLVASQSVYAGTITGTIRKLDGVKPNDELSNFRLLVRFGGVKVGTGSLLDAKLGTYRADIDEPLLRRVSQQLTGEVNMSVELFFNADNAVPASLTGVAGTGSSALDVIMPLRKDGCCNSKCCTQRCGLFRRR